jgi:hypothetical protein
VSWCYVCGETGHPAVQQKAAPQKRSTRMRSGRITRFAAVLILVAGTTTGMSALALPAQAATARPGLSAGGSAACTPAHSIFYNGGNTPPDVTAINWELCDGFHISFPATIYKDESGTWVQVASGSGEAFYYCNGTTANQYMNQSGQVITAPCV